jgi:hypothetical protein
MRRVLATSVLLCLVVSGAGKAFAQTSNGQVGGVVQDASSALIPGVSVTLTNMETGVALTQVTKTFRTPR